MAKDEAGGRSTDEPQIFDVEDVQQHRQRLGRVDMATSPNSYVAVFETPPRGGEPSIHQHPDSDQILFVLRGECSVQGVSGKYVLKPHQGVLIPAGVHYGFTNETQEPLVFLSLRTEATGGRRVGYVPNVSSDVQIRIPASMVDAKGIAKFYVYAMDRRTLGLSPLLLEDWNRASLLRLNCEHRRSGDSVLAFLPERIARWYRLNDLAESDYRLLPDPENTRVRVDLTPLILREEAASGGQ